METEHQRESRRKSRLPGWLLAGIAAAAVAAAVFVLHPGERQEKPPEVITVSTLQEIVNVSELSTYTAVYNGIAQVMNGEDPEKTDYYVSYEAKVYAGIDFEDIGIAVDDEAKAISVEIPEVTITDVIVDIASMDFIFYNDKANASTVSQQAYKACEEDTRQESREQEAIYELARQNAANVLRALIEPIVDQTDGGYSLNVA